MLIVSVIITILKLYVVSQCMKLTSHLCLLLKINHVATDSIKFLLRFPNGDRRYTSFPANATIKVSKSITKSVVNSL